VAEQDERPLSFVVDKALHAWAITLDSEKNAKTNQVIA
jgi:hypothetical protein